MADDPKPPLTPAERQKRIRGIAYAAAGLNRRERRDLEKRTQRRRSTGEK